MLQWIGYISFGFSALGLLLLGVSLLQKTKKKSLKGRKKLRTLRRLYAGIAAFFFLAGIILEIMAVPKGEWRTLIDPSTPVEVYQNKLKASDAAGAVDFLPERIYAAEDDYYIATGENAVYGHLAMTTVTTDAAGAQVETVSYQNGLFRKSVSMIGGGNTFLAVLNSRGRLNLYGAFEYQQYERDDRTFNGTVFSKDCTFVDANSNNLFYVSDGDLYSVGYNPFGQLGDGTERNRVEASKILEEAVSASVSETHTLAVDVYGNLYGFGSNSYSEMGNRTTAQSMTPIKLMGGVRQAAAGRNFSIVLTKNGIVYAAGRNHLGQLGTGDTRDYANYQKILEGVVKIAVNGNSCAALTASGTLYVWGNNANGQLGIAGENIAVPTAVANDVYDVAMGKTSMGIIKLNRDVYVSGTARPISNPELLQALYQFGAEVPADRLYRETVVMPERQE